MKTIRSALAEVVGLFVGDWAQAAGILVILALGYAALRYTRAPGVGFAVAVALAAHLVVTSLSEARGRAGR